MRSREKGLRIIFLVFDLIILNMSLLFLGWLRLDVEVRDYHQISIYILLANLSWLITAMVIFTKNVYLRDGYLNRVIRISMRTFTFSIILAAMMLVFLPPTYSRIYLAEVVALFYVGKLGFYRVLYSYLKFRRKKEVNTDRVMIIGDNGTTHLLRKIIDSNPILGLRFVGFASEKNNGPDWLGTPEKYEELIRKHQIQMVYLSLSLFSNKIETTNYVNGCSRMGIKIRLVPENQQFFNTRKKHESLGELIVINPQEIPLDNIETRTLKRLFDIGFSLAVIVFFLSWALPIIALLIKLSSKGPVFFIQERTGVNNKIFRCYKFRSMQVNEQADRLQACTNDCRITRIGKFLRKSNLDEFPQFFNVLMGDMSVVGPRPHMLKHTEEYAKLIDAYMTRHYIKPGITGWAQVNGYRGETDEVWKMQKRVDFDKEYMENWTFAWDIRIIFLTIFGISAYKNAG